MKITVGKAMFYSVISAAAVFSVSYLLGDPLRECASYAWYWFMGSATAFWLAGK